MDDAIKFEKECKRLYNNLRLTNSDLYYEKIVHGNCKKENEQLKSQVKHLSNILKCLEKGSCKSIDSFLDSYCTDELLDKYGLNEDDLFYGDLDD